MGSGPFKVVDRTDTHLIIDRAGPVAGTTTGTVGKGVDAVRSVDVSFFDSVSASYASFTNGQLDWSRVPPESVEPAAEIVTVATFCQVSEPPETVGAVGAVRSILAVACTHAERLPAASTERYSTSVSPSAETVSDEPATGEDQVDPASVDVRYS